jgi:hypothetical protein
LGEVYRLWSSSLWSFLHSPVTLWKYRIEDSINEIC